MDPIDTLLVPDVIAIAESFPIDIFAVPVIADGPVFPKYIFVPVLYASDKSFILVTGSTQSNANVPSVPNT